MTVSHVGKVALYTLLSQMCHNSENCVFQKGYAVYFATSMVVYCTDYIYVKYILYTSLQRTALKMVPLNIYRSHLFDSQNLEQPHDKFDLLIYLPNPLSFESSPICHPVLFTAYLHVPTATVRHWALRGTLHYSSRVQLKEMGWNAWYTTHKKIIRSFNSCP